MGKGAIYGLYRPKGNTGVKVEIKPLFQKRYSVVIQIQISENRAFHKHPKCSKDVNLKEIMEPVFLRKRRAFFDTLRIAGFSNSVKEVISYLLC